MTLATEQARLETEGKYFLKFTLTNALLGNPVCYWGDSSFINDNGFTGAPVYPVIASWGSIRSLMTEDGQARDSTFQVDLFANAVFSPGNVALQQPYTIASFLTQAIGIRDTEVQLLQWNRYDAVQSTIWRGRWAEISQSALDRDGVPILTVRFKPYTKVMDDPVSTVVTGFIYPTSPPASRNLMVPIGYGSLLTAFNGLGTFMDPPHFNFPVTGVPGVVIAENVGAARATVRYLKNDGSNGVQNVYDGTDSDISATDSIWIFDSGMGCYGQVDHASCVAIRNTSTEVEVDLDLSPIVHLGVVPTTPVNTTTPYLTNHYKVYDSDPDNYLLTTTTDYILEFEAPRVNIAGTVQFIRFKIICGNEHATKNRKVRFGLWNIMDASTVANWLNGVSVDTATIGPVTPKQYYAYTVGQKYAQTDFNGASHIGNDTMGEFAQGLFVCTDANQVQYPIRVRVESLDLGGANAGRESVRIYGITMVVQVRYDNIRRLNPLRRIDGFSDFKSTIKTRTDKNLISIRPGTKPDTVPGQYTLQGVEHIGFFIGQKDTGGGTYTGSASATITNLVDVLYHLLDKRFGETVNTTAGTLGNFIDYRGDIYELSNYVVAGTFGPDVTTWSQVRHYFEEKFPVRLHKHPVDGKWHLIAHEMNPRSERVYGGASTQKFIEEYEISNFRAAETPYDNVQNNFTVHYNMGTRDGRALYGFNYQCPISVKDFGLKGEVPVNEQWMSASSIGAGVSLSITTYGQYLGRRNSRPLVTCTFRLPQSYYNLYRGMVFMFSKNVENVGMVCFAHRSGRLAYLLSDNAGVWTDYADSDAPKLVGVSGGTRSTYFGTMSIVDQFTFTLSVAATYTGNAVWAYSSLGTAFVDYPTQPTNRDAFKNTGVQVVDLVMPALHLIKKQEFTLAGTNYGPVYWNRVTFTNPTVSGTSTFRVTVPSKYWGRWFEVMEVTRVPTRNSDDYPEVEVTAREVF